MFETREARLAKFHANSVNEYYAPFQKLEKGVRVNIGVYFASPMFNAANPDDDLSQSSKRQLTVEEELVRALKQISTEFTNKAATNKFEEAVQFNFLPMIPRQFELTGYASDTQVVDNDLRAINACKLFIVNHCEGPSVGTSMETFYAKRDRKMPVVAIIREDQNVSIWMRHHVGYFVYNTDIEEGISRIINNEFGHLI